MIVRLLNLGVFIAIPAAILAQEPIAAGDGPQPNTPEATVNSPSDSGQPAPSPAPAPQPLTPGQKALRRARRLIEPDDLIISAAGAGIEQWRSVPPEWGQGAEGFARRFGSAEGFTAAHGAVALGFDVAFHLDPRYRRMPQARFRTRLWNALSQTFIATKDSGGKTINVSEIAGNFGAGFIANAWEPPGYNSAGSALSRGALGLAYHAAKNVVREFLPNLLRPGDRSIYSHSCYCPLGALRKMWRVTSGKHSRITTTPALVAIEIPKFTVRSPTGQQEPTTFFDSSWIL